MLKLGILLIVTLVMAVGTPLALGGPLAAGELGLCVPSSALRALASDGRSVRALAGDASDVDLLVPEGEAWVFDRNVTLTAARTLVVNGLVVGASGASITLRAPSVLVTGAVASGSGAAGVGRTLAASDAAREHAGASGGAGGDVIVDARTLTLAPGSCVVTGDGGTGATLSDWGRDVALESAHLVSYVGGAGGSAGNLRVAPAIAGSLVGRAFLGLGGDGGDAIAGRGYPAIVRDVVAVGGAAGAPGLAFVLGVDVTPFVADVLPVWRDGASGGSAIVALSGSFSGSFESCALGGPSCAAPASADACAPSGANGLNGSNGNPGGNGGAGVGGASGSNAEATGAPGSVGGLFVNGGRGGDATASGQCGGNGGRGGNGGDSTSSTGNGGFAGVGGIGGEGGKAKATGGRGGDGALLGLLVTSNGGNGGHAKATGGRAGNGGGGGHGGDGGCGNLVNFGGDGRSGGSAGRGGDARSFTEAIGGDGGAGLSAGTGGNADALGGSGGDTGRGGDGGRGGRAAGGSPTNPDHGWLGQAYADPGSPGGQLVRQQNGSSGLAGTSGADGWLC